MLYLYNMKNNVLFDFLAQYDEWANISRLIAFTGFLDKYPIEMIITKHLYLCGIDTEEKMIELLSKTKLSQVMKLNLQNCMRDITFSKTVKIEDIPSLPKLFE